MASVCPVLHPLSSTSWGKAPGLITLQALWILPVGLVPSKLAFFQNLYVFSYFIHRRSVPSSNSHCPKSQELSAIPVASLNTLSFFRKSLNMGFSEQQQRGNYRTQLHEH